MVRPAASRRIERLRVILVRGLPQIGTEKPFARHDALEAEAYAFREAHNGIAEAVALSDQNFRGSVAVELRSPLLEGLLAQVVALQL